MTDAEIKTLIKNLHPLETKVLLNYTAQDELTGEKLQKELAYKEGHCNQAFSWLSGKNLLKETGRTAHTYYELTDYGRTIAKNGSAEERIITFLKEGGPKALPEIASALGLENKDVGSAFGPLSKEGVLRMTADKKAEYTGAAVLQKGDDPLLRAALLGDFAAVIGQLVVGVGGPAGLFEQVLAGQPAEGLVAVAFLVGELLLELLAGQLVVRGIVQQHLGLKGVQVLYKRLNL